MTSSYPEAPWRMHGDLWLSLFRLPGTSGAGSPTGRGGVWGVAFVEYVDPSPLTYHELLVARLHESKRVTIDQIWVDSPASLAGGNELWAIPKQLADFDLRREPGRLVEHALWTASLDGTPIASARFADPAARAPHLPFRGGVRQARADGTEVLTELSGRARTAPARANGWRFHRDGPLGWLAAAQRMGSVRMAEFTMLFG